MEDSVKLTDTQLRLLAASSQRDDHALERPSHLTGGAAGKVVAKLLADGLIEEIQSRGSLPVWRRDGDDARTLRMNFSCYFNNYQECMASKSGLGDHCSRSPYYRGPDRG
jgi:hypothetical protein